MRRINSFATETYPLPRVNNTAALALSNVQSWPEASTITVTAGTPGLITSTSPTIQSLVSGTFLVGAFASGTFDASITTANIQLQYSLDDGATWVTPGVTTQVGATPSLLGNGSLTAVVALPGSVGSVLGVKFALNAIVTSDSGSFTTPTTGLRNPGPFGAVTAVELPNLG